MEQNHPIIKNPHEYTVVFFQYDCSSSDSLQHSIELWLQKGTEIKKLIFGAPSRLKIEEGFPSSTHGMQILDISDRGMENINIWVTDFEASHGSMTFYAKEVREKE